MRQLDEDKIVKFNNEMFPKFGWCCILAGGAGSGKGTALKNDVAIEGLHYDPDEIKRQKLKLWHIEYHEYDDDMLVTDDGERYSLEEVGKPYTLRNPKFTSLVHQICRPSVKRFKNMLLKQAGSADESRLPNLIFDVTMSEVSDYEGLIPLVKEVGYNVAIVYVFTNFDRAMTQNRERSRVVPDETMFYTHAGFMDAFQDIMKRPDIVSMVDDVWVILTDVDDPVHVFSIKDGDRLNLTKDPRAQDRIEKFLKDNRKLIRQREMDHIMNQADEPSDALVDMAESWVYIPYDIMKKARS